MKGKFWLFAVLVLSLLLPALSCLEDDNPPEVSFSARPTTISAGETTTLSWKAVDADSARIEPEIGEVETKGSVSVSPMETTTYTIKVKGDGGSDSAKVTVEVRQTGVTMTAEPATILLGKGTRLSWEATHAESATIVPGIGEVPLVGSLEVSPTEPTTYEITVTGPGGEKRDSVEVIVIAPPEDVDYGLAENEQQGGGGLVGESVRLLNGNMVEERLDLSFASPNSLGLKFKAFYNSRSLSTGPLGHGWTCTYGAFLDPHCELQGKSFLKVTDPSGRGHYFVAVGPNRYKGVFKDRTHIEVESDCYVWHRLNGFCYGFSFSGKLMWIQDEKGNRLEIAYNNRDLPESVSDAASGRRLVFDYTSEGTVEAISGPVTEAVPTGMWVSFGYDDLQNLISVTYADGSGYEYFYSDPQDIHNLTEKRNKMGHLLNTWGYDGLDRVTNQFTINGTGVDIRYTGNYQMDVEDAYGVLRTYQLTEVDGRKRVAEMDGPIPPPYTNSIIKRWSYDKEMRLSEVEDGAGNSTRYEDYDARGNPQTVVTAAGVPEESIKRYTYHPDLNKPLTRSMPSVLASGEKVTIWDYDDDGDDVPNEAPGRLLRRLVERGFTRSEAGTLTPYEYATTYTYNENGQVAAIDGPLPGEGDTTSFSYEPETGNLSDITRPVTETLQFLGYNESGQAQQMIDLNGRSTRFVYDARGRITEILNDADGSSRIFDYNLAGLLASETDPDGVTRTYTYDSAYGRLSRITDPKGKYKAFEYNENGNKTQFSIHDSTGELTHVRRFTYETPDLPGKPYRQIDADGFYTEYSYDNRGNIASITDPRGHITTFEYDSRNRAVAVTEPEFATTEYLYDIHDNLKSIVDAEGRVFTYEYDDMGRLATKRIPDTGETSYSYNEAGQVATKTDAGGITTQYSYDLSGRKTGIFLPDSDQDVLYFYDAGLNGKGRLTGISDPSGETGFEYDSRGRMTGETSRSEGTQYSIQYGYSPGGRVQTIRYPSGRSVSYERDVSGKIERVSTTLNSETRVLLDNISYLPFGPVASVETSGSIARSVYDESYRTIITNPSSETERNYEYDAGGNLTSIWCNNDPSRDSDYTYDGLNRLIEASGLYGTIEYGYDNVGNRISKTEREDVSTYTYEAGTNRLRSIDGTENMFFDYDAKGNTTIRDGLNFQYDQRNRLKRVEKEESVLAEYAYNALGERVLKDVNGMKTIYHYDLSGNLIGESLPDGTFLAEYLYMGRTRLAKIDVTKNELYRYLNDHLGTPEMMIDEDGMVVWEARYKPFGEATVNPKSEVVSNFRLPGQYFDEETGLYYNYLRDYDPKTGRYIEPDPIGIKGGTNLYVYAWNNPINISDPTGEFGIPGIIVGGASGAFAGFVTGTQSGHLWAGFLGGVAGGVIGGSVGVMFPQASGVVGGMIGGAISGAIGGGIGAGVGKHVSDPNAPFGERTELMFKGAGIGLLAGFTAGGLGTAAISGGATSFAGTLAGEMVGTSIGLGIDLVWSEVVTDRYYGAKSKWPREGLYKWSN